MVEGIGLVVVKVLVDFFYEEYNCIVWIDLFSKVLLFVYVFNIKVFVVIGKIIVFIGLLEMMSCDEVKV